MKLSQLLTIVIVSAGQISRISEPVLSHVNHQLDLSFQSLSHHEHRTHRTRCRAL